MNTILQFCLQRRIWLLDYMGNGWASAVKYVLKCSFLLDISFSTTTIIPGKVTTIITLIQSASIPPSLFMQKAVTAGVYIQPKWWEEQNLSLKVRFYSLQVQILSFWVRWWCSKVTERDGIWGMCFKPDEGLSTSVGFCFSRFLSKNIRKLHCLFAHLYCCNVVNSLGGCAS